jgi:hypothetical protein
MGTVMIKCPKTGCEISTGIEMDRCYFKTMPVFFARTLCPICQTQHEWFARNAWVRELEARGGQSINLARINRRPSTVAMRAHKSMAVVAILTAAAVAAGFIAGDASPVLGSAVGKSSFSMVAHKSPNYAITFPEANRAAKGNRLTIHLPEDQVGTAIERSTKDWGNSSVPLGERKPLPHCELVGSPISAPEIFNIPPRRCFS